MNIPPPIKTKTSPLEKQVEARLVRKVKALGGECWKFVSPANRGVSDRIVLFKGEVFFVELKRDGGKMTTKQKLFEQKVLNNDGNFSLVEGYDGVDQFVENLK